MNTQKVDEVLEAIKTCIIKLNTISDGLWSVKLRVEELKLEIEVEESDRSK